MNPESKNLTRIVGAGAGTGMAVGSDADWLQIAGVLIAAVSTLLPILQAMINRKKNPPAPPQ